MHAQATMWGDAAKDSYDPNIPDYVSNILGPMRKYYVNERKSESELLLSKVWLIQFCNKYPIHYLFSGYQLTIMHLLET